MSAPPFMPLYIGDYLSDTMHLTRDQHGAYILLIMAYWRHGGPLPDDGFAMASITKSEPEEWEILRETLAKFFKISHGFWRHRRIDHELSKANQLSSDRSKAGSKGAAKRWQGHWQNDAIHTKQSHNFLNNNNTENQTAHAREAVPAETPWEQRCDTWAKGSRWLAMWGPAPDEPGCLAPSSLIDEAVRKRAHNGALGHH